MPALSEDSGPVEGALGCWDMQGAIGPPWDVPWQPWCLQAPACYV